MIEELQYLADRGDVVEFSLMRCTDGRTQGNRRFAGSDAYGVAVEATAAEALRQLSMQTMQSWPFPDGPLQRTRLPIRQRPWDPDLDNLIGDLMPKELDPEAGLNELLTSGEVAMIRWNLCRDGHWELYVKWAEGRTGPTHWACRKEEPLKALRDLIVWARNPNAGVHVPDRSPQRSVEGDISDLI